MLVLKEHFKQYIFTFKNYKPLFQWSSGHVRDLCFLMESKVRTRKRTQSRYSHKELSTSHLQKAAVIDQRVNISYNYTINSNSYVNVSLNFTFWSCLFSSYYKNGMNSLHFHSDKLILHLNTVIKLLKKQRIKSCLLTMIHQSQML